MVFIFPNCGIRRLTYGAPKTGLNQFVRVCVRIKHLHGKLICRNKICSPLYTQERMNRTQSNTRIIHMADVSCYLYQWARG